MIKINQDSDKASKMNWSKSGKKCVKYIFLSVKFLNRIHRISKVHVLRLSLGILMIKEKFKTWSVTWFTVFLRKPITSSEGIIHYFVGSQ